ncbi:hypothetical protein [Bradyrhizobium sp. BR 10289]|nr:hypothetical protein [Bradyrhizobium sp. BR 10289]MBW7970107.1 hypothetical protein [Bradyrhizobium sp. BR 10289]
MIGDDLWRWTIFPIKDGGLTFVDSIAGHQEKAIAACREQIDMLLSRGL